MSQGKINIGIAGMGFGKEFIGIYQNHPLVDSVAICMRTRKTLDEIGDRFGIPAALRFDDYDDMLACASLDAIHVVTPILDHAVHTIAALNAGKHTACTVPMAVTLEDCAQIVKAKQRSGKVYMMMETSVYTREFLYVQQLKNAGKLGKIQFLRGAHMQNMGLEGWPEYWKGLPPMHYGTHAISPLVVLAGKMIESVVCHGSGTISEELAARYQSPFAVETATFKFMDSDLCGEATRSLYDTVRQYTESFCVYGSEMSYEWEQLADEGSALFLGGEEVERVHAPDALMNLPAEIAGYTKKEKVDDPEHVSFVQGSGHGGSHPHLAHEFLSAIAEGRDASVDAVLAANITGAGIAAHLSALAGGVRIALPDFQGM